MTIIDELISTLRPEAGVKDIRQGLFYTAVLTRNCGLAATLPADSLRQGPPAVERAGDLLEENPIALARMARSDRISEAAIGMATINSLLEIDDSRCRELNAGKLVAEKGADKSVVIVGHFPFVAKLRNVTSDLRVIENNPHEGDYNEAEAEIFIPDAEVVAITGTALTNHTMEALLAMCNPRAYVVILGGSTPMSELLLDYGANAVCGTKVTDPELALRCVSQGATYRQIRGIKQLVMT
jgi:hypothetical protein